MKQGSEEWHEWRKSGIGASEAAAILNVCIYNKRKDVLFRKLGQEPPQKRNPAMDLGTKFEENARALLFFELGFEFDRDYCGHLDQHPFVLASFDGFSEQEKTIAEIKYMGLKNFEKVRQAQMPLKHHFPQIQQQLLVSGFDYCIYAVYTLNDDKTKIDKFCHIPVFRNNDYINEQLLPALIEFQETLDRMRVDTAQG